MSRVITTRELKKMMDTDERFVLVNVLDYGAYEQEHICGSINVPLADIEKNAREILDKDEQVVVYGSEPGCVETTQAAEKLASLGFRDVVRYEGGMLEWTVSGLCTEGAVIERQKRAAS